MFTMSTGTSENKVQSLIRGCSATFSFLVWVILLIAYIHVEHIEYTVLIIPLRLGIVHKYGQCLAMQGHCIPRGYTVILLLNNIEGTLSWRTAMNAIHAPHPFYPWWRLQWYTVSHFSYAPLIKCKITQKKNTIFYETTSVNRIYICITH